MTDDEQRMRTINNDAQLTTRTITNRVDSIACWFKRINGTWGWKVKQSECGSKANDQRVVTTAHSWLHNGGPVCFLCWVVSQANFCVSHSQLASPKNTRQIRWQNKYSKTRHWNAEKLYVKLSPISVLTWTHRRKTAIWMSQTYAKHPALH